MASRSLSGEQAGSDRQAVSDRQAADAIDARMAALFRDRREQSRCLLALACALATLALALLTIAGMGWVPTQTWRYCGEAALAAVAAWVAVDALRARRAQLKTLKTAWRERQALRPEDPRRRRLDLFLQSACGDP